MWKQNIIDLLSQICLQTRNLDGITLAPIPRKHSQAKATLISIRLVLLLRWTQNLHVIFPVGIAFLREVVQLVQDPK